MLDTAMEVSIWLLLDLPRPQARKMTHGMNAERKRQWLDILSANTRLSNAQRDELRAIADEIGEALRERNRVVHGLGSDGAPWAAKYNEKGNLTFHRRLDAPLIRPIAQRNKKLAVRLAKWNEALEPEAMSSSFPKIP
jgi:hypothetical protein